jgi:hypothetical protein
MRVTGIDVSECDVKFAAGEGRRAIVDGGRLEIDKTSVISDSSFRSCVVFGSGVAQRSNIEGECTWRGCRLEGATVRKATVTLEACQCVDLEVHGGSIALKAQAHVSRLVVTDGTVSIEKGAILDESEITNARVDIFGGSLAGDVRLKHARVFGRTVQRSDLTVASEGVATGLFMIRDSRDGFMFERKDTPAGVLIFTVLMESERLLDRLQRRLEKEVSSERLPDFMQYIDRSREFIRSGQKVDGGGKDAISRLRKRGDINRRES